MPTYADICRPETGASPGTEFPCFTSKKVQKLTQTRSIAGIPPFANANVAPLISEIYSCEEEEGVKGSKLRPVSRSCCNILALLALLVQKYKY